MLCGLAFFATIYHHQQT